MSLHGYERETTPRLDRFAEDAVVFEHCWANAPWTTPSYMSQFTGLYATSFRVPAEEREEDGPAWWLADAHLTLAERLAEAGYRTAAFVDNPNVAPEWGFGQGFELYDTSAAEIPVEDAAGGIRHLVPLALEWLDGLEEGERFFLFVQALDVHGPYLPDGEWKGLFAGAQSSVPDRRVPIALSHDGILGAIPKYIADPVQQEGETSLRVRPLVDAYDEEIRALDDCVGSFLEELGERGWLDETLVVFSADHGESLVEHDSYFDHQLVHGEDLHVPFVVRPPGGLAGGRRVATRVQLVDLLPTVLELSGLDVPGGLHGRSLAPLIQGDSLPEVPIVAHGDYLESRSIVLDGWKLIESRPSPDAGGVTAFLTAPRTREWIAQRFPEYAGKVYNTHEMPPSIFEGTDPGALFEEASKELYGPFHELYRLERDPGELVDLAVREPQRVVELLERLDAESERAERARRQDARAQDQPVLSPEMLEELRKLGYVDGE
jgi:arylsulfatase A-like enzyme